MKFSVPKSDGECLLSPSWEEIPQLIEANHSVLESCDVPIGGTSFRKLRAHARRNLAAQTGQSPSPELRIVVGAHQPGFHGPGILCKHGILEALARDSLSVNFVVDSDVCKHISVNIPYLRGEALRLKEIVIFSNPDGLVFETLLPPPKETADSHYDEIEKLLASVRSETLSRAFRDFRAVHERVYAEGKSVAAILTGYRRDLYPTPHVHETSISAISQTEEFLLYACDILEKIEAFHAAYNSSLDEHRSAHRIRNRANPFPDLVRRGELWEAPFWSLDYAGRRRKVFAGVAAGKRFAVTDAGSSSVSPIEPEGLRSLRLRPRAVCLTMFLRLFLSDAFVHGVGGGNYDRVTDRIIERYYGVQPPGYIVASRTKYLARHESRIVEREEAELRSKLRRLRHEPEAFAPEGDAAAAKARRILSESAGRPSAAKHAQLQEARAELLERIMPQISLVEKQLAAVEERLNRDLALRRRDLPYFLYPHGALSLTQPATSFQSAAHNATGEPRRTSRLFR